ncbi:hypothetical protein UFO1_2868 [Pelosinus sp. UFO1]|nr:hypothetical protein UFO1_2868 [Pelosinus sp. UFO1]
MGFWGWGKHNRKRGVAILAQIELTTAEIMEQARNLGAEFVGFATIDRWEKSEDVPIALHPHRIWPQTKTVIVLGVPSWQPSGETSPTIVREQSSVINNLLDEVAYRLAVFLNRNGYPAVNIPWDSEGEGIPEHKTIAVFSHVWAGHYAGQSQVSKNNIFRAAKYNPQLNFVSVLTAFELKGDV